MQGSTRSLVLAGVALASLGLSACGDTDRPEATADCASGAGTTVTVEIGDFDFDPTPVDIGVCDEVVWHNGHDQAHTSSSSGEPGWNTGNLAPDQTSEPVRFEEAGDHAYLCALHPFMEGTVSVS